MEGNSGVSVNIDSPNIVTPLIIINQIKTTPPENNVNLKEIITPLKVLKSV